MFNYLYWKFATYFIFMMYLSAFNHTVMNTYGMVSKNLHKTFYRDLKIELVKRELHKQENLETVNNNTTVNNSDENTTSTGLMNVTVKNKFSETEDHFNSTASLPRWMLNINDGALQRTGFVALGFMSIIIVFFIVRAVRLRQKRSKSRKYGIITSTASDMEMEPLDKDDDEEEDTTLFDAQLKYSLQ